MILIFVTVTPKVLGVVLTRVLEVLTILLGGTKGIHLSKRKGGGGVKSLTLS